MVYDIKLACWAVRTVRHYDNFSGDRDEWVKAWTFLHKTGLAYTLPEWYGTTAKNLILGGIIKG